MSSQEMDLLNNILNARNCGDAIVVPYSFYMELQKEHEKLIMENEKMSIEMDNLEYSYKLIAEDLLAITETITTTDE